MVESVLKFEFDPFVQEYLDNHPHWIKFIENIYEPYKDDTVPDDLS